MTILQTDTITNAAGTGSPSFPYGIVANSYAAGNNAGETVTNSHLNIRSYDPTGNVDVVLNNTWVAGKEFTIIHAGLASSTALITLKAHNSSVIATIYPGMTYKCISSVNNPTLSSQWFGLTSIESQWMSFTPTQSGFGSISNAFGFWRRQGDSMDMQVRFITGTPSGEARINLPNSHVTAATKIFTSGIYHFVGHAIHHSITGSQTKLYNAGLPITSQNYLVLTVSEYALTTNPDTAQNGFGNGNAFSFWARTIPISGWSQTKG